MKDKLTLKQRRWLDLYIETGNATEAAMQVYNCKNRNSAKVIGCENLTKLNYSDLLTAEGLSDDLLLKGVRNGLNASKLTSSGKEMPDLLIRYRYLELALKLRGRLTSKIDVTSTSKEIRFPTVYIPQEVD